MEKLGVADYGMMVWYGGHYDYDERLANIRKIGFDGLERLYPTSAEDALRKASNLKKLGMSFATCNSTDPELAIRWTAALGGQYVWAQVLAHTGPADIFMRQVKEQTKIAKKYGIEVAVHNHMGLAIETQEQLETLLAECPDVKLLFDTGHLAVAGGDVEYIAKKYYDRIIAYHLKGWKQSETPNAEAWHSRGHFCGLGQGDLFINNEEVYKNAVRNGFNGWVFIEHDTHERDPLLDLKESYDILKKWRNEI